jgi:putative ABC transport system permease protein
MIAAGWGAAWRMAWREARSSAPKFIFVIFGVAAGVGALTGVRGFASGFQDLLKREARTLMAGDMLIRLFSALTPAQEAELEKWRAKGVRITPILETVSMVSASPGRPPLLTSIKAVDTADYPFYGQIKLDPPQRLAEALAPDAIAVSDDLLMRLDAAPGSRVKVGQTELRISAVVKYEPDRMTGSLNVGPRAMMSKEALQATGLMQIGSRAARRFLFKLPAEGVQVATIRESLRKAFPEALISDYRETHPIITRTLDRSTTFLSLVSLIALIVGALGVATAVHSHIQQRLDTIAILKCLGARNAQIIRIYALQTTMLGMAGGLAGVAVGAVVQQLFPLLLAKYFQFSGLIWSPAFALEGLLTGVLVSLLFTLPPLLAIREVKPALIFRREMAEVRPPWKVRFRRQIPAMLSGVVILCGLGLVAAWLAGSARVGWTFIGGLSGSLLVLSCAAWLLLRGLKRFVENGPFRLPVAWRHGLANLYRPGNHAASILVSLGIGVMFTLTIHLIQSGFLKEVVGAAPPGAPNVFLINITDLEKDGVREILEAHPGRTGRIRIEPFASARLIKIGGRETASWDLRGFRRRFLSAREVTIQDAQPEEVEVRQGAWWNTNEKRPLIAVSEQVAEIFSIVPGMQLRWMILGREFDATVAAVYRLRQVRMSPVSDFVFNPVAMAGAPTQWVATGRWKAEQVPALQLALYRKYPTVTAVNAADILNIVQEVIDQVALLVRFISLFAIAAGAIILAATVAGTRLRRVRESAVLKTIGARRRHLTGIFSVEFSVVGAVAGLIGGALAIAFTRILLTRFLDSKFELNLLPALAAVALTSLLATATGWLASLRVLDQRPLEVLRDE